MPPAICVIASYPKNPALQPTTGKQRELFIRLKDEGSLLGNSSGIENTKNVITRTARSTSSLVLSLK